MIHDDIKVSGKGHHQKSRRSQKYKEMGIQALGKPTSLNDLKGNQCRFPVGDPKYNNFHFCGAKTQSGKTYCDTHHAICHATSQTKIDENNPVLQR